MYSPLLDRLIEALRCLPGVGPKTAQRMAFHLLDRDRDGGRHLAATLLESMNRIGRCRACRTLSETEMCAICLGSNRDPGLLCVLETPADMLAIEQSTGYRGLYFVLMGRLSPLDGIGPSELGLDALGKRLGAGHVREVILATNPTVEGETTAHFIAEMVHVRGIKVTRIAHGVPMGGELEYIDSGTLSRAFSGRLTV